MAITNIVPIRIDASSTDGASRFRIIDTLLIDTTCLPISYVAQPRGDCASESLNWVADTSVFSLDSLVNRNAAYLAESILADAEVYGAVRSSKHYLGGRLDLLSDTQLYRDVKEQISTQLSIAMNIGKSQLTCDGEGGVGEPSNFVVENATSSGGLNDKELGIRPNIVRIKLRLRQENIVVAEEFDYDINLSGLEGSDPFSIANSMVEDLKLPREFAVSIATSIVEQIYGIDVPESVDSLAPGASRDVPAAYVLNVSQDGSSAGFAQMILDA
eukprot:CCRYP_011641-RE/>CCRYP_011641-RE protein AED:0.46 eAED:0.46 QI:0/0/0/1/0/0/2/0/271